MVVSRLALDHFRSWDHCLLDLASGVTILQGANGLGKTNIVEALEVLATGSSHRATSSLPLVQRGHTQATIRANVSDEPDEPPTTVFGISRNKTASADARRFAPATNCIAGTVRVLQPLLSPPEGCQWGFVCKRI